MSIDPSSPSENDRGGDATDSGERRVIKRYSNRKLYDTKDSRYVTLLQIADMVRAVLRPTDWRDGIEGVSGLPHWLTLRVT